MKRSTRIALLVAACLVAAAAIAVIAARGLGADTTLEFRVRDAVSGRWVWDMAVRLQNRTIIGYYQSDTGPVTWRFTRLRPGPARLTVDAHGYQAASIPVTLRRGANRLEKPVEMVGLGIPDLQKFYIFESRDGADLLAEIRPVNSQQTAILNHPCMDLWIGCRVSVQMKGGVPAREESEEGGERGEELFRGQVPWTWDPAPETQFRYSARIPLAKVREHPSAYRVIDYLIVEPNPLAITRGELADLMTRVYAMDDPAAVAAALDAEKGRLRWFLDTSWNVKAREQ
jgi:hypothetical protein